MVMLIITGTWIAILIGIFLIGIIVDKLITKAFGGKTED